MSIEELKPEGELKIDRDAAEKLKLKKGGSKPPEKMTEEEIEAEIMAIRGAIGDYMAKDPETSLKAIDRAIGELKKEYPQYSESELMIICGVAGIFAAGIKKPKHWEARAKKQKEKAEAERQRFIEKLDKMSLDELIQSCQDPVQRAEWEKIRNIEFPQPKKKVKIVRIVGGIGLNDKGELDSQVDQLVAGYKKVYPEGKLEVVTIPYPKGRTGKEALRDFEAEVGEGDADIIIPVFSGHGSNNPPDNPDGQFVFHPNIPDRHERLDEGITTDDLLSVARNNGDKQFLFTFDACFSGSATDELLAEEANVVGIMASQSKERMSGQPFTSNFGRYLSEGMGLGEAFIRADAAIRGAGTVAQNPGAVFHAGGQKIEVS